MSISFQIWAYRLTQSYWNNFIRITLILTYVHTVFICYQFCFNVMVCQRIFSQLIVMSIWWLKLKRLLLLFWFPGKIQSMLHFFSYLPNRFRWLLLLLLLLMMVMIRSLHLWYVYAFFVCSALATYLFKCEKMNDWTRILKNEIKRN